ncbi:MAG: hypothetical protein NXI13_13815 [Proteobacteria bacterium]|nr:hypothetical protein [Pseudomonadota bacterium]
MWSNLIAGAALGALTGLLIGLSSSAVVGSVIGALTALLAGFFGLRELKSEDREQRPGYLLRIMSFAFACLLLVAGGLYLRTHDTLSPSPKEQVQELTDAGFSIDQALQITAWQRYGVTFSKASGDIATTSTEGPSPLSTILFSIDATVLGKCADLHAENHADPDNRRRAFEAAGGIWRDVAVWTAETKFDTDKTASKLEQTWTLLCSN